MATAGKDGTVKVWDCRNWKGAVREWSVRGSGSETEVEWSQRGFLGVASGGSVNVCNFLILVPSSGILTDLSNYCRCMRPL
jgi:U3 small nucleolar RNA-associated protein 7